MRVQRVLMQDSGAESWTVLGEDLNPVGPVEQFLAYLAAIERSPNTIKAYAHDLKDWLLYLTGGGWDWRTVTVEQLAGFISWLRLPPAARAGEVAVLPSAEAYCAPSSVQRKLSAVTAFYEFHARHGVEVAGLLVQLRPAGRPQGSYRPFLQHVAKQRPQRRRTITVKNMRRKPRVLTAEQAQAILDGCEHLRDRLLFAVMLDTGVRIGEALGLRHSDLEVAERTVTVRPRANDNRARAKGERSRTIPTSPGLMRLYADYLNREYGSLDSDYVFVNLWAEPFGRPWTYRAVYDLVQRLRVRTGSDFEPHQFRHTYATWLLRRGAGIEAVKELLGHRSISTTIDTYSHLTVEDARRTLQDAGWFTGREVRL
ncbi:tyrosine-type recombinase/integrase [Pseudonocardia sp. WMMC193]|uniref:tyrosine-type recombinase/integrase n=1 Tax=Pseudonocardia sp. WMMC193 TaxID=2911965 RepID=UPI001F1EFD2E|nr:tyrosine-type recombinase/integrase [Pseudonocardia sp. WMMC193]MCF7547338.1 site-specific integrase [Pseudonocardia sp. WMMC193]